MKDETHAPNLFALCIFADRLLVPGGWPHDEFPSNEFAASQVGSIEKLLRRTEVMPGCVFSFNASGSRLLADNIFPSLEGPRNDRITIGLPLQPSEEHKEPGVSWEDAIGGAVLESQRARPVGFIDGLEAIRMVKVGLLLRADARHLAGEVGGGRQVEEADVVGHGVGRMRNDER